ncbi:MAG: thioredoxin [Verrucomicrobiota bacterium]|nr:thioredoxin [Verrucomicrobiota bacterium]
MNNVIKLGREEDFEKLISKKEIAVVDFYADWCGPCKMMAPALEEIAKEAGENVMVLSVDVDKASNLSNKFSIRSIPTILLFKDGEMVQQSVGVQSKSAIWDAIESIK